LALAGLVFLVDAAWLEPSSLVLTRHVVPLARAPALAGLKIAVIGDLHAGAPYIDAAKIDAVVAMTNQARPDLILLTGDYVIGHILGGRHMAIETIVAHLKPLSAPLGVYAVIGNHDRWENADHIASALSGAGFVVLENAHHIVQTPRGPLDIVGIGDATTNAAHPARALAGLDPDDRAICLTHSPDVFPRLPWTCALTVAGHTHGGQVRLPFVPNPIRFSRYGQRYVAGLVREDGKSLFVNTGIGTSVLPLRFGVPPEISLLVLQ
jgi:predicted MPP superfamily phosphohydrolase